ncbi:tyrosine-protein phosphatase [Streptomyces sp. ventii]|uniref:Tyrosine-protein phosphatase n=1 Tax=Streptomyces spiramenti TaxID=2720606 RepID=A0ABX1AF22_9ACTN|nr:tyrosine-protein phosphatase [Streptomyces spiramenti]
MRCSAGKDRTGPTVAPVLLVAGVGPAAVEGDHLLSGVPHRRTPSPGRRAPRRACVRGRRAARTAPRRPRRLPGGGPGRDRPRMGIVGPVRVRGTGLLPRRAARPVRGTAGGVTAAPRRNR